MTASVTAAIYCRISLAGTGDTTKVADQERICRQLAGHLGWEVHDVYSDNSISAWNRKKRRPEWERMIADVDAGLVTAIISYHGDRMYRQPRDLEHLIDLAEGRGMRLASPMGEFDLSTSQGRIFARMLAAIAEGESARHSERRKQQYERWRREGKVRPGGRGGRAFGFSTGGDVLEDDRCIIATREVTGEPRIVREMATRILGGESAGLIAHDVTSRGWRTPAGRPFTHSTIRKMLSRPRYAGLMPDGATKAAWDAILTRDQWEQVRAVLDSKKATFLHATNSRRHLLSGLALCGICGATMQIWRSQGRGGGVYQLGYICSARRHMFRSAEHLDAYVSGAVVAYLNRDDWPRPQVPANDGDAAEFATLSVARADLEMLIADHETPNVRLLLTRLERLDARLAQLRDRAGDGARARLLEQHRGTTDEQFAALPLSVRRALVAACLEVTVLPSGRRGPGFHPEYVELRRR